MSKRLRLPKPRPAWSPFHLATRHDPLPDDAHMTEISEKLGVPFEEVKATYLDIVENDTVVVNSLYQVNLRRIPEKSGWPAMIHLSIKRLDKDRVGRERYRDFLRIKNELVGPEHEGLELYPAMERNQDTVNQYHLWVCADPTIRFPFGFTRGKMTSISVGNAKQHPFDEAER